MESKYLYILLVRGALVILGLIAAICYYRLRYLRIKTALIRCLNENFEMKDKLRELDYAFIPTPAELKQAEVKRIIRNVFKVLYFS